MENLNKISKSILAVTILSFTIFIGSYLTKLALINQFFDAETMELKSIFANNDLSLTIQSLLPAFSVALLSYLVFLVCFILFLVVSKPKLRNYGWLFIITLILVITTPFEIYLIFKYDWTIVNTLFKPNFDTNFIINLLKNRITGLGPFPLVLLFSNFLIIFLATFKPLQKGR